MKSPNLVGPLVIGVLLLLAGLCLHHASSVTSTRAVGWMFAVVGAVSVVANAALLVRQRSTRHDGHQR